MKTEKMISERNELFSELDDLESERARIISRLEEVENGIKERELFGQANQFKVPKPKLHIRALVRDKHGRPRFDDPAKINQFRHRLSESDLEYLKNQFPDAFKEDKT